MGVSNRARTRTDASCENKLDALGREGDKRGRDRAPFEVAQEMSGTKMLLVWIDRVAQTIRLSSFGPSHANENCFAFSNAGTVVSHDSVILEPPNLAELTVLNGIPFS